MTINIISLYSPAHIKKLDWSQMVSRPLQAFDIDIDLIPEQQRTAGIKARGRLLPIFTTEEKQSADAVSLVYA